LCKNDTPSSFFTNVHDLAVRVLSSLQLMRSARKFTRISLTISLIKISILRPTTNNLGERSLDGLYDQLGAPHFFELSDHYWGTLKLTYGLFRRIVNINSRGRSHQLEQQ
jgi:hypothetical protein